jgi:hypothetical protein
MGAAAAARRLRTWRRSPTLGSGIGRSVAPTPTVGVAGIGRLGATTESDAGSVALAALDIGVVEGAGG